MPKRKLRYIFRIWSHYAMGCQCFLLLIFICLWIALAVSLTEAGPGGPFMSLDDRMAVLTEKLHLTDEQRPYGQAVVEVFSSQKRKSLMQENRWHIKWFWQGQKTSLWNLKTNC